LNSVETKISIDLKNFSIDKPKINTNFETRYIKPPYTPERSEIYAKYKYAEDLAKNVIIANGQRTFAIIDGSFIFGDLIEAICVEHNLLVDSMTISTLSMSENNIDSLANLINGGYVQELNLIVSAYFYSHERYNLIDYAYKNLDIDDKFQLAVAGTHCKTCIFVTNSGTKVVIHGSANLRSSSNIEQIMIECNDDLYDFNYDYQQSIIRKYKTINKPIRHQSLWHQVVQEDQKEQKKQVQANLAKQKGEFLK